MSEIITNPCSALTRDYVNTEVADPINEAINSCSAKMSKPCGPNADEIVTKCRVNRCGPLKFRGNGKQIAHR